MTRSARLILAARSVRAFGDGFVALLLPVYLTGLATLLLLAGENVKIDVVSGKALSVLGHAKLVEPVRNLLHGSHQRSRRGMTASRRPQRLY